MTTKFKPGKSGNPAGRKPGSKDKRTELRELLRPHAADLINKAVEMALAGDSAAMRICIDRIVPTLKSTSESVSAALPIIGTLDEQASAIFKFAASGDISTDNAAQLINMLSSQCRIKEVTDFETRLQALEKRGTCE